MVKKALFFLCPFLFVLLFLGLTGQLFANVSALFEQAEQYAKNGQHEQAEAIYHEIVADYPGTDYAFEAQKNLAILYVTWNKQPQADRATKQLIAKFSGHDGLPEGINKLAGKYGMKLKRYDKSRELHQYILDHYPDHEQAMWAQRGLAFAHIHTGDYIAAEAAIDKLFAHFSEHKGLPKAFYWLGNDYYRVGRYQRARELYQYALDKWPGTEDAIWLQKGVAVSSVRIGDDQTAEAALGKLLNDFPEHEHIAKAVNEIADCYYQSKKYEKAREIYRYTADKWPQSKQAIWSQKKAVLSSIRLGDQAAANSATGELLAKFSAHARIARVVTDLADGYRGNFKKYNKALLLYQHVLDNWPDAQCAIWAQKGIVQSNIHLGDDVSAQVALDRLIADFSNHTELPIAVLKIGEVYCDMGLRDQSRGLPTEAAANFTKAIAVWERIITRLPESDTTGDAHTFSGDCYRRLGQYGEAVGCYQEVVDNWPDHTYAWYAQFMIARCYMKSANSGSISMTEAIEQARLACEKVIANYPNCKAVKAARNMLK